MKKPYLLFFTAIVALFSCKKELNESPIQQLKTVSVEGNYLKFQSAKVLDSLNHSLLNKPDDELDAWESNFNSFKSLRALFNKVSLEFQTLESKEAFEKFKSNYANLVNISADSVLNLKVPTSIYAKFLNQDGALKIGDTLFVYTESARYSVINGTQKDIENIKSNQSLDSKSYKAVKFKSNNNYQTESLKPYGVYGVVGERDFSSSDRRVRVQIVKEYPPVQNEVDNYYYLYIRSKAYKKGLFGWTLYRTGHWMDHIATNHSFGFGTSNGSWITWPGTNFGGTELQEANYFIIKDKQSAVEQQYGDIQGSVIGIQIAPHTGGYTNLSNELYIYGNMKQ